jgi:hypothetical protein
VPSNEKRRESLGNTSHSHSIDSLDERAHAGGEALEEAPRELRIGAHRCPNSVPADHDARRAFGGNGRSGIAATLEQRDLTERPARAFLVQDVPTPGSVSYYPHPPLHDDVQSARIGPGNEQRLVRRIRAPSTSRCKLAAGGLRDASEEREVAELGRIDHGVTLVPAQPASVQQDSQAYTPAAAPTDQPRPTMRIPISALIALLSVPRIVPAQAHDTTHRSHAAAQGDSAFAAVQRRGALVMGVDQYTSTHQFQSLPDGGRIELQREADDSAGVRIIREHLRTVARQFAAGNFSASATVHARAVPGTDVMRARRRSIRYAVRPLPRGGELRITTRDPDAVRAVHEFLAFQRADHRAGEK